MNKQTEALKLAQKALSNRNARAKTVYEALHAIKEALAQPEQEPDAFDDAIEVIGRNEIRTRWRLEKGTKLYTTPPQRKPLTLVELSHIFASIPSIPFDGEWQLELARAIEAAHGIKE